MKGKFSLSAFLLRFFLVYAALTPAALAALYRFAAHQMPDMFALYDSAGPLGVILAARIAWILSTRLALPVALVTAFFGTRRAGLAVALIYLLLALSLIHA